MRKEWNVSEMLAFVITNAKQTAGYMHILFHCHHIECHHHDQEPRISSISAYETSSVSQC